MKKRMFIFLAFFFFALPVLAQVETAWVRKYNGPQNSTDYVTALTSDNFGKIYVVGSSVGIGTGYDYATVKYDANGSELWVRRYNGTVLSTDAAYDLAIDNNGNVYVTGYLYLSDSTVWDYVTIKYDANGNELWVRRYNGTGNDDDGANAIAIDGYNNIYVTGYSWNGIDYDYATVKYDANGNELWVRRYNGPAAGDSFTVDDAHSIAIDGYNNIYVTGYSSNSIDYDYATVKYDANGNELWVRRYNGPAVPWRDLNTMVIDDLSNVYVSGTTLDNGTGDDFTTVKYVQSSPISTVRIETIDRISGTDSLTLLPSQLTAVILGDRLRIKGKVLDGLGNGIPNVEVRCLDPITGDLFTGDSAIFRVVTDNQGYFIYPDLVSHPEGIVCNKDNFFAMWFNADPKAIPLIIAVYNSNCPNNNCVLDSLVHWLDLTHFPDGTIIGIPDSTNPLFLRFPFYPPNELVLGDTVNNLFFEGYAWCYTGRTNESFLVGDTSSWLERGLWLHDQRVEWVAKNLNELTKHTKLNSLLSFKKTKQGWVRYNESSRLSSDWLGDGWNFISSHAIETGVCIAGAAGTLGIGTGAACAPLVVDFVNDAFVKPYVVTWVCDNAFKQVAPWQCRATGELAADATALIVTINVPSSPGESFQKHIKWFQNPRNLMYGRPRAGTLLINDLRDIKEAGQFVFETSNIMSTYYIQPSSGTIQSFGFANLTYVNPNNPSLYGMKIEPLVTIQDQPRFQVVSSWDDVSNPQHLQVEVNPDRNLFAYGTTNYVQPTWFIEGATARIEPSFINIDYDANRYSAVINVSDLPDYQPGQPYMATITASGYDLNSNFGSNSSPCGFGTCTTEGLTLRDQLNQGISIDSGSVNNTIIIGVNSTSESASSVQKALVTRESTIYVSGNILTFSPDTLTLLKDAQIFVQFDTTDLKFSTSATRLYLCRWDQSSLSWQPVTATIDSITGLITGHTRKLGIYAPVFITRKWTAGDVNWDGQISITDVVYLVNYLFKGGPAPFPVLLAGDARCDGQVSVSDIIYLINYLFKGGPPPNC